MPAFLSRYWPVFIAFLGVAVLAVGWNRSRAEIARLEGALAKANRAAETDRLRDAGFLAASEAKAKILAVEVERIPELKAQLARLQAASPGARVVGVMHGSTGAIATSPAAQPITTTPPSCPPCLYPAEGSLGEVEVREATAETKDGVHVVLGYSKCIRVAPEPRTILFEGSWESKSSSAAVEPEAPVSLPSFGHAVGVAGFLGASGTAVGAAWSPPPWQPFDRLRFEGVVAGGLSPKDGRASASAAILGRWR